MTQYIIQVMQYGKVVRTETAGSLDLAKVIANQFRAQGFQVRVTDSHNASYGI
jgi:hypothetical protein